MNRHYQVTCPDGQPGSATPTLYYYLGGQMIAVKEGGTLRYVHQDHLTSASVATDVNGATVGSMSYMPYGSARAPSEIFGTDRKFTGQRLDGTGLYFYNARYYDAGIGRFISPDTIVPDMGNPQAWNRYSYVLNNPLRYTDPTGHVSQEDTRQYQGIQRALSEGAYGMCDEGDCGLAADLEFVAWYDAAVTAEETQFGGGGGGQSDTANQPALGVMNGTNESAQPNYGLIVAGFVVLVAADTPEAGMIIAAVLAPPVAPVLVYAIEGYGILVALPGTAIGFDMMRAGLKGRREYKPFSDLFD